MSWTDAFELLEYPTIPPQVRAYGNKSAASDELVDTSAQDPEAVATFVFGGILLRDQILWALHGSRFMVAGSEREGAPLHLGAIGRPPSLAILEAEDCSNDFVGLASAIRQRSPSTRIVLAGNFQQPNWFNQPLGWIDGLVQGDVPAEVMIASLDLVMLGAAVLPTSLTRFLIEHVRATAARSVENPGFDNQRFINLMARRLSALERTVLSHLKNGATNKVIARQLNLTVSAVTVAVKGILRKLDVQNRTQAALWALEHLPADVEVSE